MSREVAVLSTGEMERYVSQHTLYRDHTNDHTGYAPVWSSRISLINAECKICRSPSKQSIDDSLYNVHGNGITETPIPMMVSYSFGPSVREALQSFAFSWGKVSDRIATEGGSPFAKIAPQTPQSLTTVYKAAPKLVLR